MVKQFFLCKNHQSISMLEEHLKIIQNLTIQDFDCEKFIPSLFFNFDF